MDEEKSLKEEIQDLKKVVEDSSKPKKRKFRMPIKGKVNRSRLKKGFATIVVIDDNKNVDFTKEPIIDGTIKLTPNDTFHAIEDYDVFTYKGKPIIFQPKSKLNPYNPLSGTHQTYGQKYVMARMEGDKILTKKKIGMGVGVIIGLVILAIIGYAFISGGGG